MKRAIVDTIAAAGISPTKELRHRLAVSITKEDTLSNPNSNQPETGSVMWAEPIPLGMGTRSGGPDIMTQAIDVTRPTDAKQQAGSGAAVAGDMMQRWVPPTDETVIEGIIDDVAVSPTKDGGDGDLIALQRADGYAVIRRARGVIALMDIARSMRKDTSPSSRTIEDYQRKCQLMDMRIEQLREPSDPPLQVAFSHYAPKRQSFFGMRAAMRWRARNRVIELLATQDRLQRIGSLGVEWLQLIKELDRCTKDLEQLNTIELRGSLAIAERAPVKARSKKQDLRQLKPDWRDRFLDANQRSKTYRAPVLLMRHCGMRPQELEWGVKVARIGDTVRVVIQGAKVRETAGQPWRTILLNAALLPSWFLDEIGTQERTISADAENMRTHLARVSNKLFVRGCRPGKRDPLISAYVFRHALVTDLYANGFTTSQMAAVLGETAEDTVSWYGFRPRGGSHPLAPVAIVRNSMETARPVRASNRNWVASAGKVSTKAGTNSRRPRP